jgi:lipopolysaccharide/colanic/teichoic acid biosynthesis glycosyltransferase
MIDPPRQSAPIEGGVAALDPRRSNGRGPGEREVAEWAVDPGTVATSRLSEGAMRLLDIVLSAILIVVLAPFMLIVTIVICIDSAGSPVYRQRRLGRRLEPFKVTKFRTMHPGVGADTHRAHVLEMIDTGRGARPMTKLEEDKRLTRIGPFLRRTSIDELPQLWNVLHGDMSLVGPRPPIQYEVDRYPAQAFRRFAVRPGMTGLWQVEGRSLLTFRQMIELDCRYVEQRSFTLNLSILLRTLPTVLRGKGAA